MTSPGGTHQQPAMSNFVVIWADAESLHALPTL